jgi:hypothetical protein
VPDAKLHIALHVHTEQQVVAFSTGPDSLRDPVWGGRPFPAGLFRSTCRIPGSLLNSGVHRVHVLVIQDGGTVLDWHEDLVSFEVLDSGERLGTYYYREPGAVRPILQWKTESLGELQKCAT